MTTRDAILSRIRQRVPKADAQARQAVAERLANPKPNLIPDRGAGDADHRIAVFTRYMEEVGGSVEVLDDPNDIPTSVARHLRDNNLPAQIRRGRDEFLGRLPWHRAGTLDVSEGAAHESDTASLSHAFAGAAELGTVVLVSGPDNPTTLNFLPDMHVVVLEARHLYGDYEGAWRRLREVYGPGNMPRTVNMISGPSRTADIEQTIVRPAHGPKNMHVIIVEKLMPLQNRVTPFGEIIATEARGTMLGNRGGRFHRDDRTLGKRCWATHHWICCELHFKNMHHEPMGKGYTSLFFLDEVTALAAGHRPCFFCRRPEAKRFFALMEPKLTVDECDRMAHAQRLSKVPSHRPTSLAGLPDATMISLDGKDAWAIRGDHLLRWSPQGYTETIARTSAMTARLLTPPLYVGILARGYEPRLHGTALELTGGVA